MSGSKVIAYHLILTANGFWLPNDPRGSGPLDVWSDALKPFGPATKVTTDRSVAARPHDRSLRLAAKQALKRPPVRLTGPQARCAASRFATALHRHDLACFAFSVMPDHAHFVLGRPAKFIERIATDLKGAAVHALLDAGLHPYQNVPADARPKIWARGSRHVFLFDASATALTPFAAERN